MGRIAVVGGGSKVFARTVLLDMLAAPAINCPEFVLFAPSRRNTDEAARYIGRVIEANDLKGRVTVTTDRREALDGADYVITAFNIGGIKAFGKDYGIPKSYRIHQVIGDTLGPGGIFRALRSVPVLLEVARDMEELCPDALLLNYVNPMAPLCWAVGRETEVSFVGLCHGVQNTLRLIGACLDIPPDRIDFLCAGINHMAWFLELEHHGKDLYPELREKFTEGGLLSQEPVRGEVFRHFGYFMTESSLHLSEYVPWFGRDDKLRKRFGVDRFSGRFRSAFHWRKYLADLLEGKDVLTKESTELPSRSLEYCSSIVEAAETGDSFTFNGNVINEGLVENLPEDCCVEVPVQVEGNGFEPKSVGMLPPQCAALNKTNVNVQQLVVEAAITGNPELVVQACTLDPLTSSILTPRETREMVRELFREEEKWLPQFEGHLPGRVSRYEGKAAERSVDLPPDPAFKALKRLEELARAEGR